MNSPVEELVTGWVSLKPLSPEASLRHVGPLIPDKYKTTLYSWAKNVEGEMMSVDQQTTIYCNVCYFEPVKNKDACQQDNKDKDKEQLMSLICRKNGQDIIWIHWYPNTNNKNIKTESVKFNDRWVIKDYSPNGEVISVEE